MDYKRFEENIYKYIVEYNNGREKAIKKISNFTNTLNITDTQMDHLISSLDSILRKNVYKYYHNKIVSTGKSIYTTQDDGMPEDNVKKCISKKYKIQPIENLGSLSSNTFATKINGKNKIINFSYSDNYYTIEENYKRIVKLGFIYKELAKLNLTPKIHDIVMCMDKSNERSVKSTDYGYYIIIYDNPADYKKLNAENIKKLSGEDKKTLLNNLKLFSQKILDNKIIPWTEFGGEYSNEGINWLFFDNNLKIAMMITDNYTIYRLNDREKATMNKNVLYKKMTKKIFKNTTDQQNLYINKYIILRLIQDKQLLI